MPSWISALPGNDLPILILPHISYLILLGSSLHHSALIPEYFKKKWHENIIVIINHATIQKCLKFYYIFL
jgi:hypothetical protein